MAQEVEHHHALGEIPPGPLRCHRFVHSQAVFGDNRVEVVAQRLVEFPIVNDQIGFKI